MRLAAKRAIGVLAGALMAVVFTTGVTSGSATAAEVNGSDCTGFATLTPVSRTTVRAHWEIYCTKFYYLRINLAPILQAGGTTYNFQSECASLDGVADCVLNKTISNPSGTQNWWATWDPDGNGAGVSILYGPKAGTVVLCNHGVIYCGTFSGKY